MKTLSHNSVGAQEYLRRLSFESKEYEMSLLHNQFRVALKRGSGRAMFLLQERSSGQQILADLMHACETDLRYDPQCEESRAAWLYRLVRETGQTQKFLDQLSRRLSEASQEADAYDMKQVFEILCIAAKEDKSFDRVVLRDFLLRAAYEPDGINCISSFIELEGIDGLLLCVRRYHRDLADEGGWVFQMALETLAARDGKDAATGALTSARASFDELDRLLMLNDIKPEPPAQDTRSGTNYSILRSEVDSGGFFSSCMDISRFRGRADPSGGRPFARKRRDKNMAHSSGLRHP